MSRRNWREKRPPWERLSKLTIWSDSLTRGAELSKTKNRLHMDQLWSIREFDGEHKREGKPTLYRRPILRKGQF